MGRPRPRRPAQAETEDAALIEWRETSAPWADEEYAASRAEVFLAALNLHKTLIAARADVFAGNLGALMDLLCADPAPTHRRPRRRCRRRARQRMNARRQPVRPRCRPDRGPSKPGRERGRRAAAARRTDSSAAAIAAAWQSLFLVVPVVHMPFGAIEPLFAGLGPTSLGWLLADHAERLPGWQADSILGRLDRAVFAGDTAGSGETALDDGRGARSGNGDVDHNRSLADDRAVAADEEGDVVGEDRRGTATTRPTTTRPTGASKATAESESTGGSKPTAMGVVAVRAPSPMPSTARKT